MGDVIRPGDTPAVVKLDNGGRGIAMFDAERLRLENIAIALEHGALPLTTACIEV